MNKSKNQNYLKKQFYNYSFVLLLSLTGIFLFVLGLVYREQYSKHIDIQAQLSANVQDQIDSSLMEMDKIINGLLFNKTFVRDMKQTNSSTEYIDYNNEIIENFISLDAPLFSTYRIIAFNDKAYYTLAKAGESSEYIKNAIADYPWKQALLEADGKKLILPPHEDSFDGSREQVYSIARSITDGKSSYGFIEVQNHYSNLEKACALNEASGYVALYSPDGELLYPAFADPQEKELYHSIFEGIRADGKDSGSLRSKGQQISYEISDYSGWITVVYCPVLSVSPYGMNLILLTVGIYVLMAALALLLVRRTARRMAGPLMELNRAISNVTLENMTFQPHISTNITEINNITQTFQRMLEQLQEAIARSVQSRTGEERANYLALQAQMNPHTLYNTLSMIESVSYMNGDKEVSALCVSFSQMLRYISDYTRREYTMSDELNHLSQYSTLAQKRYEGKLTISVHADPELLSVIVPKFTIQPIVENAVKHSFATRIPQLHVETELSPIPGGWHLLVRDNGPGFTEEALAQIQEQFEDCDRSLKEHGDVVNKKIGNLGLTNIYIRCRILYGDAFRMTVGNHPDDRGGFIEIAITEGEQI